MSFGSINSIVFGEYCERFNNVTDVFTKLNNAQVNLLKEYYTWASIRKFEEAMSNRQLSNGMDFCGLRSDLTKYIDYQGKEVFSICILKSEDGNLGVDLADLAKLKLSDHEIRVINNVASDMLQEFQYICYLMDMGATEQFEQKYYPNIRKILDLLYDVSKDKERSELYYCNQFLYARLPLATYLVRYYKNSLINYYKSRIADGIIDSVLHEYNYSIEIKKQLKECECHLIQIMNEYLKQDDSDNSRKRAIVRAAIEFMRAYSRLSNGGKTDFRRFVESSKQTAFYVTTALGERLATKGEIKSIVSGVYKKDTYFLPQEKRDKLFLFGWCVNGDEKYYNLSNVERYQGDFERVEKLYEKLLDTFAWLNSEEFLKYDIKELAKGAKPIEYPDKAEDEIKEGSLVAMLKYIKEHGTEDTNYDRIALDIANKCIKYKSYAISEKQLHIVKTVYEKLTKPKEQKAPSSPEKTKNDKPNFLNDELMKIISELVKHPKFKKDGVVASIIGSVLRYKRCSEKQYDVIVDEHKRLFSPKEDPFSVFGIPVFEIDTSTKGEVNTKTKKGNYKDEDDFLYDDESIIDLNNLNTNVLEGTDLIPLKDLSDSLGLGEAKNE